VPAARVQLAVPHFIITIATTAAAAAAGQIKVIGVSCRQASHLKHRTNNR